MSKFVEGFTNMIQLNSSPKEKDKMKKLFISVVLLKILLLFIIYKYLWPYVMPKLFKSAVPNPSFKAIVLLYLMIMFLF
tara:strand:+ start:1594 stop:1830 length:237 start_codon:yes stop_codon:yes gene_type:complete